MTTNSPFSNVKSWPRSCAAIWLALTLCAAGCATSPSAPSVNPTAAGNAWRIQLPPGTRILPPTPAAAAQMRAVGVNETVAPAPGEVVTTAPLVLASPAWFVENTAAEMALHRRIADLEIQLRERPPP